MSTYKGAWDRAARPKIHQSCCSACGQVLRSPKARRVAGGCVTGPVDTGSLTDSQLYAHYKRTVLAEDLAFFLRLPSLSPDLRMRAEAISKPTTKDIQALRTAWRAERQTSDRERGIPSIGSPRWKEYLDVMASEETVLAS